MLHLNFNGCQFAVGDDGRVLWVSDPARIAELVTNQVLRAEPVPSALSDRVYFNLYLEPITVARAKFANYGHGPYIKE